MARKKNVFVVGLDDFNLEKLKRLPEASECRFLPAVKFSEMRGVEDFSIPDLLKLTDQRVDQAGYIDAVVSYFDFPGSVLVPIIAEKYDLPGPSLKSVMRCEHKYCSRKAQYKVIPDNIPAFQAFDPFDDNAYEKIGFKPPFWIKPIKSYHSYLAYHIKNKTHFNECIKEVREHIDYMSAPFSYIIQTFDMPENIRGNQHMMFAETPISGHQCTVEGYVFDHEVVMYGVIDSITAEKYPSFTRYQYPSSHPYEVQYRMGDLARLVIKQIGLNNAAFNIEFFYNEEENKIFLLEVNPRISQSHSSMFEHIHGISNHEIMLNLALGRRPEPLEYKGEHHIAAHFMHRAFNPGVVSNIADNKTIAGLKKKYPEMALSINVEKGQDLDDMEEHHTDSYSYVLADLDLGAENEEELLDKYNDIIKQLEIQVKPKKDK
ncbi:MAG: acetyl-CoA carboxylase biotin carboxylase subunit family protein [Bacteroidales bacterium]